MQIKEPGKKSEAGKRSETRQNFLILDPVKSHHQGSAEDRMRPITLGDIKSGLVRHEAEEAE
jgi:hypothetical protein